MIDTVQIRKQTNLMALIGHDTKLKRVARTEGGEYHGPCPFCGDGRDRFIVQPHHQSGGRWLNRQCCGSGRWRDAIAYVQYRDKVSFPEACNILTGDSLPLAQQQNEDKPDTAVSEPDSPPPSPEWQSAALTAVFECCDRLHYQRTAESAAAYEYLVKHRGLTKETIFNASLGYNPTWCEVVPGAWLPPGITIPNLIGGNLWYVQVRTTKAARSAAERRGRKLDKYHCLGGSVLKSLYGADRLKTAESGVIVEGEFDALLLSQFTPEGTAVATMGSANTPPAHWRLYLAHLRSLCLVMDSDKPGAMGLDKWQTAVPWAEALPTLEANDITDYWAAGGDLAAWIKRGAK